MCIFLEVRQTTQETEVILTNLQACKSYLIGVGIVIKGPGPLSNPIRVDTDYDEDSPPRNVSITVNHKDHQMIISWQNSCPFSTHNPKYLITITEQTYNKTSTVELKTFGDKVNTHTFNFIHPGGVYKVSISTTSKNAKVVTQTVYASALPAPRQLKVYPEKNGSYVVHWNENVFDIR